MSASKLPLITVDDLKQSIARRPSGWRSPQVDVAGLERELRSHTEAEIRFDAGTKAMYAVDAGNYRQAPIGVVIPKSKEDVVATIAACRKFGAPLLSRAGGSSIPGQTCNTAIVMDWSKYVHGVLEIDTRERWARVLPGTICDELLDQAMEKSGHLLTWGPDPATHPHCCFGGMIGNNSCGAHAQMSGKAVDNVEELDILLYDGTRMKAGWTNDEQARAKIAAGGREGEIYRALLSLRDRKSTRLNS